MIDYTTPYELHELLGMTDLEGVRDVIGDYVEDLCGYRVQIADKIHQEMYQKVVTYYETGEKMEEYRTKFGAMDGTYRKWKPNGILFWEREYVDGKLHGVDKTWYLTGQLREENHYVNGKRCGTHTRWFPSGQMLEWIPYDNDELHGVHTTWYQNGHLDWQIPYHEGKEHGTAQYYYKNGLLKKTECYHHAPIS